MGTSPKKILVVEDDESLRIMLVTVFEDEGYDVGVAENGNEAWGLINTNHYDLLVTDLYMPQMNGMDLVGHCRPSFPELNIIMLSGGGRDLEANHGGSLVELNGKQIEVDIFMKKPCNLGELLANVKNILQA